MKLTELPSELETVQDPRRAELLLHPLRQRILGEAGRPSTAAEIARRVDQSAQKVNYHVRALAAAGFLVPAGEGRRRNLIEKRYRASARSYVLLPSVLGRLSAEQSRVAEMFSANHLIQLAAALQVELSEAIRTGDDDPTEVPTFSMDAELRFDSKSQRGAFAAALREAVADVIGRFSSPDATPDGAPATGRAFRLILGCYPIPPGGSERPAEPSEDRNQEREE